MISQEHEQIARQLHLRQPPGEADEVFMDRIDRLMDQTTRRGQLKVLGGTYRPDMTSAELDLAIRKRQLAVLKERGFVSGAKMRIDDKTVKIVAVESKRHAGTEVVKVKYLIIEPWDSESNVGRVAHRPARTVLEGAVLI